MSDFDARAKAAKQAAKMFDDVGKTFQRVGATIGRYFQQGLYKYVARRVKYQRRAARLNARPRKSKRHGARRGVK